ncbi:MAG: hypothetical protein DRI74_01515 [Bacteroidetes bacterium]|nr:MAG: hypothetical protein DRI74_01515 [Bacteroidota bacterium]
MKNIKVILFSFIFLSITLSCNTRKDIEFVEQGKVLFLEGKYNEAIPYFSKAIKKNTRNDEAHAFRGFCYYSLENYSLALIDFSNALERNPNNGTALFGEACIRWNLEDYNLAFQEFNHLIHINPNHDKAYFYRARAYLYKGDTTNAINDLTTAMEKDSCFIDTYYLLASVMTAQKKYNQADKYLELALKCKQKDVSN